MDKIQFWQTIEDCRKAEGGIDGVFLRNIKQALEKMTAYDIIGFQAYLNIYMEAINLPAMWEAAALINKGCSDDGFDDFRAWLISQGEYTYYKAFEDPDSLYSHPKLRQDPLTHTTELCSLEYFTYQPADAYKTVTGHEADREFYRAVDEKESEIAVKLSRDFSSDDCMKIQHKPEDLEMAFPQLAERCYKLGYDPKELKIWYRQIPTESWGLQI